MKRTIVVLLFSLFLVNSSISKNSIFIKDSVEIKYEASLQKIVKVHNEIKSFYKVLEHLQPIAIAENGNFYIFDADENSNYKFEKNVPCTFTIPKRIRAAMPLEGYGLKSVCVVTGDAFDNPEDYIVIFHEFVHCVQFQTVESKLKENLEVYKEEMGKNNYMWEIAYNFPYEKEDFVKTYGDFLNALDKKDAEGIKTARGKLKVILSNKEYEYMTWQEWKEGYARFIENKLQKYFNYKINEYGKEGPYNRVTFYEGGAKYITYITENGFAPVNDLESLYKNILN